jgi:hypothetical protein
MITIKAGTKAASKVDAYAMVQRLAVGETLAEHETHSLLLYFAPSSKPKKDAYAWVASFVCTDKNDPREYLRFVYSNGTRICATNGHALAWAPSTLPPGFYHPKTGDKVVCDYVYPDVDRVIPAADGKAPVYLEALETVQTESRDCPMVRIVPCADGEGGMTTLHLDDRYTLKAMAGGNARLISIRTCTDSVRGECDMGSFVIMPRRK